MTQQIAWPWPAHARLDVLLLGNRGAQRHARDAPAACSLGLALAPPLRFSRPYATQGTGAAAACRARAHCMNHAVVPGWPYCTCTPPPSPSGLWHALKVYAGVWAEIVRGEELVETRLNKVASWWLLDAQFCQFGANWAFLDIMNKSKEHGFLGFRNTVKSFASRHMDRQAKGVQDCSLMPFIYLFLVVLRPDAVLYIT